MTVIPRIDRLSYGLGLRYCKWTKQLNSSEYQPFNSLLFEQTDCHNAMEGSVGNISLFYGYDRGFTMFVKAVL